jgi:hypothetical protein
MVRCRLCADQQWKLIILPLPKSDFDRNSRSEVITTNRQRDYQQERVTV